MEAEKIDLEENKEEEEEKKRRKIIILVLLLLILLLIVFMVSYSMFAYTKKGDTDNTVTSGKLQFLYTENTGVGNGINITEALPISDEIGKSYSTENYVFDFKITAKLSDGITVPYEVTARMAKKSELPASFIKLYLVERNGSTEIEAPLTVNNGVVKKFSELADTTVEIGTYEDGSKITEKTIYSGIASGLNYEKDFRLRMWVSDDANFDGVVQDDGSIIYPYNDKSFTTTVNVYSINK